jgi:DNA-binding winged helix-turn-helix (wHTH) protein
MSLRFCGCTLDLEARRLFRGPDVVHLSPKAFEMLRMLAENRPRPMSKAELLTRVWPDAIVTEGSLARVINEIRDTLGDDRKGRIIRTVHTHGYAFVAQVEDGSPHQPGPGRKHPVCWLISAAQSLPLHEGTQIIGRDPALDLVLDSAKVSRHHARIEIKGTQATIEDLGSKNGTFVGGTRIEAPTALYHNDNIQIGRFRFVLRREQLPESTETEG